MALPRTCLVTGAGRGIGRSVALSLAAHGHRVAVTARSADQLEALGIRDALAVPGDITESTFVDELFQRVEAHWGPVEVLVANAGAGFSAPIGRTSDDHWDAQLDVNLTAPFRCLRRAVPSMVDAGFGRVIVVASIASKVGMKYMTAYTAAKHGVLGMVRAAAAELAATGVTVNAVCPGYVDTPMTDASVAAIAAKTRLSEDEARAHLAALQPIGRLITPEEIAALVTMLLDAPAITGQGLNIDGGAHQA